jgi:hypothetical protein
MAAWNPDHGFRFPILTWTAIIAGILLFVFGLWFLSRPPPPPTARCGCCQTFGKN